MTTWKRTPAQQEAFHRQCEFVYSLPAPFMWVFNQTLEDGSIEMRALGGGTMFFVKTSVACFGITAAHVMLDKDGYRDTKGRALAMSCRVANFDFDPEERLIDIDKSFDLATFRFTEDEVASMGKNILICTHDWPPAPPKVGDVVFFAGCPGIERKWLTDIVLETGIFVGACHVHGVNEREVTAMIEREYIRPVMGKTLPPVEYNARGISGGPMLLEVIVNGVLTSWRIAGIITSGPCGETGEDTIEGLELYQAKRADYINVDGTINRDRWE